MSTQESDPEYQVDVPVTVPPSMAEDMLADLEETGKITIEVRESNVPNIAEQIQWQLDNDQPLLTFVDEYDTEDDEGDDPTPQEVWEEHNESFDYEPPERPPEAWSSEEYTELHDRVIGRRTQWYCQHCSTSPFSSLEKARRHVEKQHNPKLIDKYAPDQEPATDGGQPEQNAATESREETAKEQNHGLSEFDNTSK